jgi:Serine endopeptidase inhibitors
MSDIKLEDLDSPAVPFFARYLEGQYCEDLSEEELSGVGGGTTLYTKKYPSDQEDSGCVTSKFKDLVQTLKYPSDQEDSGGGGVTKKYPSDSDEVAVTQKYPSDGDDHVVTLDKIA